MPPSDHIPQEVKVEACLTSGRKVEGDLLPGCGWTPLTASHAGSRGPLQVTQPELRHTAKALRGCFLTSHVITKHAKHTWSCAFFFFFLMDFAWLRVLTAAHSDRPGLAATGRQCGAGSPCHD